MNTAANPTIMVIDDDESVRQTLDMLLSQDGYQVDLVEDGATGLERAVISKPNLVIVDLRMPGLGGMEVCKRLRAARMQMPVIVLSAASDEMDKVLLLELGADDYIVKPFGARELLARVKAALRRAVPESRSVLRFASVEVDIDRRFVTRRGEEVKMTPAEYNLLTYFLNHPDRVLTREAILNDVWGFESAPTTRTVDAHVVKLRQKLESDSTTPRHFLTVHGVGYRFVV